MPVTVVINGIPQYITSSDIAFNLKKLFDVRISNFQVRDLRETVRIPYGWQFALDFNSFYEARIAQDLLHGEMLQNDARYMLCAKITEDPRLMTKDIFVPAVRQRSNSYSEYSAPGIWPRVSEDKLHRTCTEMDAQIGYFNTQNMFMKVQREFLRERRKLWREYKKTDDMNYGYKHRSLRRPRPRSGCKPRYASRSCGTASWKMHISENCETPGRTFYPQNSIPGCRESTYTSMDMRLNQSQNICINERSLHTTTHVYKSIETNITNYEINYNQETKTPKLADQIIKFEMIDATKYIIKELDTMLDQICYEKNISILQKGFNFNIITKLKGVVKERVENLDITDDMSSNDIVLRYKHCFSKHDDKRLIEDFIDEYIVANPHILEKCNIDLINAPESSINMDDFDDSNMWRAIEEVLQDVDIETLSSDNDDKCETNKGNNALNLDKQQDPRVTEMIDITHDVLVDRKNNRQVEIIVVLKNNTRNILKSSKNDVPTESRVEPVVNSIQPHTVTHNFKSANRKPYFFITIKDIMKKMNAHIAEFAPKNVERFRTIVQRVINKKISVLLKDKEYMKSANITKLFREHYPKENDKEFIKCIAEDVKSGKINC